MSARIRCRAVLLDAGGVIVLPDRRRLAEALARAGITIDPEAVPRAHYRAVRALDRATGKPAPSDGPVTPDYPAALFTQLGILPGQRAQARAVWEELADRGRAGEVLWSEATPGARAAIKTLRESGITVAIVTNSDGHAAENLADAGFAGLPVLDSEIVGARKPDVRIFEAALTRAGVAPTNSVHVGDTLADDIAGARAAGITPIHFDPLRLCRARDHRHVRALPGLWQHLSRA